MIRTKAIAALLAGALLLSACGGNDSNAAPQPLPKIAGEYTGTVQDSASGAGTTAVTFSQSGSSVGGTLAMTYGAAKIDNALALTISSGGGLAGTALATINNATCAFHFTGTYDETTNRVTGSYAAASGCAGQTGTYVLDRQCTDPVLNSDRRRTLGGAVPC
ncbi:MAG TPA: hypothetical protein VIG32_03925 [Candidatus Baltobacteraceae bacterium]|jgi:hypothetical protein